MVPIGVLKFDAQAVKTVVQATPIIGFMITNPLEGGVGLVTTISISPFG